MLKLLSIQIIILAINFYVFVIHMGTIKPITIDTQIIDNGEIKKDSSNSDLTHIFLKGSPYNIGYENGRLLQKELNLQEDLMIEKINDFIPSSIIQKIFFFASMIWFNGIEDYIDEASLSEMEGVSKWVSQDYNYLASPLTRQIAYHGIHEVGQMFVDEDHADLGCFASIINDGNNKIIGRNFDFDIDGNFDKNKIIKWVFPKNGIPYLSIIFPGMVGAVTGINEKGIYISINAGGSKDWRRVGTPTTIVLKQILESSSTIFEALEIIKKRQIFITDIFLLASTKTNEVYKIEKTPNDYHIKKITSDHVISNHLEAQKFIKDPVNLKRKRDLTTVYRYNRGLEILKKQSIAPINKTINILRDKKSLSDKFIHFGHRGSIDSMIASHSVILSFTDSVLYINEGPGTSGRYIGLSLDESFKKEKPIVTKILNNISDVSRDQYLSIRKALINIKKINATLDEKNCFIHKKNIFKIMKSKLEHYEKDLLISNYYKICEKDLNKSKALIKTALEKEIPFYQKRERLKRSLNE